jgi:hypothetical protein
LHPSLKLDWNPALLRRTTLKVLSEDQALQKQVITYLPGSGALLVLLHPGLPFPVESTGDVDVGGEVFEMENGRTPSDGKLAEGRRGRAKLREQEPVEAFAADHVIGDRDGVGLFKQA